jgi:hypothetical protein
VANERPADRRSRSGGGAASARVSGAGIGASRDRCKDQMRRAALGSGCVGTWPMGEYGSSPCDAPQDLKTDPQRRYFHSVLL